MTKTFSDSGEKLSHFEDYRIVACPKCDKPIDFRDLKLSCILCGFNKTFKIDDNAPITIPLNDYLAIECCGNTLWAYNIEHLEFIESYVAADIRKRQGNINKSLLSRLPQWIKAAKNRNEILKAIEKLKHTLEINNYKKRND